MAANYPALVEWARPRDQEPLPGIKADTIFGLAYHAFDQNMNRLRALATMSGVSGDGRFRDSTPSSLWQRAWYSSLRCRRQNGSSNAAMASNLDYIDAGMDWDLLMAQLSVPRCGVVAHCPPFLFLTMAGTPEALKLRQHLGLSRREIDWLRLDQLSAFMQTDLAEDVELCEMLDQCGCGHLLKMEEVDGDPSSRGYATEIRRYLGIAA